LTMRLAVVRMPSRWARTTAALMPCDRPKSSALTTNRRDAAQTLKAAALSRPRAPAV